MVADIAGKFEMVRSISIFATCHRCLQWSVIILDIQNQHCPECTGSTLARFLLRSLEKSPNSLLGVSFCILNQNGT